MQSGSEKKKLSGIYFEFQQHWGHYPYICLHLKVTVAFYAVTSDRTRGSAYVSEAASTPPPPLIRRRNKNVPRERDKGNSLLGLKKDVCVSHYPLEDVI